MVIDICVYTIFLVVLQNVFMAELLYAFEEQFNLPFITIQLGNGQYIKLKVIGYVFK